MKTSTIILLIIMIASVGATVAAIGDFFSPYIQTTIVTKYSIPGTTPLQGSPGNAPSVYQFQTPVMIQSGAVLTGNLTNYCVQQPASQTLNGRYLPNLYVLTSTEQQLWNVNNGPPKSFVANTEMNGFQNYTYSGPTQTEGVVFYVPVKTPDVYYFLAYLQTSTCGYYYSQSSPPPAIFLNVITVGPNPIFALALKIAGGITTLFFALLTIRDHWKDGSKKETNDLQR